MIHFTPYKAHTVPLFVQSNIIPVKMLYFKTVSSIMYDVSNNLTPPNISTLFTCSNTIHQIFIKKQLLYQAFSNKSLKNYFSRIGAKIWNGVPPDIRKQSKHNFKTKLHGALLMIMSFEDTYVDASTLISKLLQYS